MQSTSNPGTPTAPQEVAFFDTWPEDNNAQFNGLWNNYPYFASGTVVGSDIEKGLFVWWVGTPQVTITPVSGDPDTISAGGQPVSVQIGGSLAAGTAKLHVDTGSGFAAIPLADQGGGVFSANLPATACGTVVRYTSRPSRRTASSGASLKRRPGLPPGRVGLEPDHGRVGRLELNTGRRRRGRHRDPGMWACRPERHVLSRRTTTPAGTICFVTAQSGDVDAGRTT